MLISTVLRCTFLNSSNNNNIIQCFLFTGEMDGEGESVIFKWASVVVVAIGDGFVRTILYYYYFYFEY
jgi:hypothetical protein